LTSVEHKITGSQAIMSRRGNGGGSKRFAGEEDAHEASRLELSETHSFLKNAVPGKEEKERGQTRGAQVGREGRK